MDFKPGQIKADAQKKVESHPHSDPHELKRLIAELAVKKGFCSKHDADKALLLQKKAESGGKPGKMLGMVMLENGIIDNAQFLTLISELDHIVHNKQA